jgi:hypothetical protein
MVTMSKLAESWMAHSFNARFEDQGFKGLDLQEWEGEKRASCFIVRYSQVLKKNSDLKEKERELEGNQLVLRNWPHPTPQPPWWLPRFLRSPTLTEVITENESHLRSIKEKIGQCESFLNKPLNRLRYHTYELGEGLDKWLQLYNQLAEGVFLNQLSEQQIRSLESVRPVLERALKYFERCVRLHQWHIKHSRFKGISPTVPIVGIKLEELQEVVQCLVNIMSDDALNSATEIGEQEVALIKLQEELGAIPALLGT